MTRHARTGFRRCGASPPQLSSGSLASAKYSMRTIIFQILCALTFQHLSAQVPSSDYFLSEEWSPQQNILVQHYYIDSLDRAEIWLIDKRDSSNVFLLDSVSWRGTSVIFSPDQAWLAENVEIVIISAKSISSREFKDYTIPKSMMLTSMIKCLSCSLKQNIFIISEGSAMLG